MADYANVKFLRGSQASLTTLLGKNGTANSFTQGAFYLTSDTDRLYFAQSDSELVPLNQFIRNVAAVANLPSAAQDGDYYYCKAENVLAVWDASEGANGGWIQLNPDHNNRINNSSSALTSGAGTNTGEVKINMYVDDDGTGADQRVAQGSVTLKPSGVVQLSQSNNEITIGVAEGFDTQYEIKTAATSETLSTGETGVDILLDSNATTDGDSDITIKSANNRLAVSQASGVITLTAADQGVNAVDAGFDSNGQFRVGVKDKLDADYTYSSYVTPTITYGDNTGSYTTSNATFNSGTAVLDVYTKAQTDAEIDKALAEADALTYKGTVSSSDASTKLVDDADFGTVYKASGTITSPVLAKPGDLIIAAPSSASAEEGTANSVTWDVIPSGDDQTISWTANQTTGEVGSTDGADGSSIKVAAGTHIAVSHALSGKALTTTVAQAADYTAQTATSGGDKTLVAATSNTATTQTFTAVTGIQTDTYGNVVNGSVQTATLTVTDSHANINAVNTDLTVANNTATIQTTVADTDSVSQSDSFGITSENLTITAAQSGDAVINLEWGTF